MMITITLTSDALVGFFWPILIPILTNNYCLILIPIFATSSLINIFSLKWIAVLIMFCFSKVQKYIQYIKIYQLVY